MFVFVCVCVCFCRQVVALRVFIVVHQANDSFVCLFVLFVCLFFVCVFVRAFVCARSNQLEGSTGEERTALHDQLHEAIQTLEDEKFISMGMTEADKDMHRSLLRLKHAIVIQLVDDDELKELNDDERAALMEKFEDVEIKMVSHMKDYFIAQAKAKLGQ